MNLRNLVRLLAGSCLLAAGAASMAAVKPLSSTTQAARASASMLLLRDDARNGQYLFVHAPRDIALKAMGELAIVTTFQGLLQTPGGITLNCQDGGTVAARLSRFKPRTLTVDWRQCAQLEFSTRRVNDGLAEVVLLEDSFTPVAVASIRLGERHRDLVETLAMDASRPDRINYATHNNLRVTGYLPLRKGVNEIFLGRYLAQVIGFNRILSYLPDTLPGEPDADLYPDYYLLSTTGTLMSGESTNGWNGAYGEEISIIAGDFDYRYVGPVTPTRPTSHTVSLSYGGTGLRMSWGLDDVSDKGYLSIDGVARMDYNQWWGFGCSKPDEFSYRTRTLLEHKREDFSGSMFDSGQITINGNSTATYTASGTWPFEDRVGHVALNVPRAAPVSYDVNGYIYGTELMLAGNCTP